jgi:AbiV family abortive infection protein
VPSKNKPSIPLSSKLLRRYRDAAIDNARELLYEATLLLSHNHYARAYHSCIAAIEEVGTAVQVFDALGRNIHDADVVNRFVLNLDDYGRKVTAAVFPWLLVVPDKRSHAMPYISAMIKGQSVPRDQAMRTRIDPNGPTGPQINTPNFRVTYTAAEEWLALAKEIYAHGETYVLCTPTKIRTKAEDEVFAMKSAALIAVTNNPEFWEYYISCMKTGNATFEAAVSEYVRGQAAGTLAVKDEYGSGRDSA